MSQVYRPRRGFTLLEVVVVMAMFLILMGMTLSAIFRVRENSNRMTCLKNLKELGLAVHHYHKERLQMPPYATGKPGELYGGWYVHLLPYAGYDNLYSLIVDADPGTNPSVTMFGPAVWTAEVQATIFPTLICPSDPSTAERASRTNYLANWYALTDGTSGAFKAAQRFRDLTDGLSNIVLFAEGYRLCDMLPRQALLSAYYHNFGITQGGKASDDPFYAPEDYTMFQTQPSKCDKWRTQTPHAEMHVALADGSVRTVRSDISPTTWKQALKPRDGEVLGNDW